MPRQLPHFMTADDIGELLIEVIRGVAGGTDAAWRRVIGKVQRVETWRFVAFNWLVTPMGTAKQRDIAQRAIAIVRAEHPYVV